MAPTTPIGNQPISQSPSVAGRQQPTVHIVRPSTQNASSGSSSTVKLSTIGLSSHTPRVTEREKSSTARLPSTRASSVNVRPTTPKPAFVSLSTIESNPPNVPSTSVAGSSTTRRNPFISVQSPGGNHPNYSTILPPISQGQHGAANGGENGANTSTIIAGVLVPLILIGVAALALYIWYRRKYPVRMVLGRDFNRFSNPAYNKRASTLTLVRNDERKEWDTLCRRNPDLSMVNEDEPGGIENEAFDSENEEGKGTINDVKPETDIVTSTTDVINNRLEEDIIKNEGIRRERPKTKKAILVKTSTIEDFENGFELVTESDLGQRTESEVSSGNDSTETHTISLTFSETFDDRHKVEQSISDSGDVKDCGEVCIEDDVNKKEITSLKSASEDTTRERIAVQNDNALDESDIGFSSGDQSFEIVSDMMDNGVLKEQEEHGVLERMVVKSHIHTDLNSPEISNENPKQQGHHIENESNTLENVNMISPLTEVKGVSENEINYIVKQESIQESVNIPLASAEDERDDDLEDTKVQGETDQYPSNNLSFETISPNEQQVLDVDQSNNYELSKTNITDGCEVNVLEKEKTESLEKEKTSIEGNNFHIHSTADVTGTHSEISDGETDSQDVVVLGKKPPVQLSNENIVLDSDPQSPLVLVQESFILENEYPLPVYLDNTDMSPRRGRRAFTLNDIASRHTSNGSVTSEFSLPNLKDEISKSSPVIFELKTPTFACKQSDFKSKGENESQSNEDHFKNNKVFVFDNNETEPLKMIADESEGPKRAFNFHTVPDTETINENKDSQLMANIMGSTGSYSENTYPKKDTSTENDETFISMDSNSFEFTHGKAEDYNFEKDLDNNNFDDFTTDPINLVNTGFQFEAGESTNIKNTTDDGLHTINFLHSSEMNFSGDDQSKVQEANEIGMNDNSVDDNAVIDTFPQSSTPVASFVVEGSWEENEDQKRKKLSAQTFDFSNFDDSDSESSGSAKSCKNSENTDTPTLARNLAITDTQLLGTETFGEEDSFRDKNYPAIVEQTVESLVGDDMLNLTRSTDSSTGLSWELLSRENSQDLKSNDITEENIGENILENLDIFSNRSQNNYLLSSSSKPGSINLNTFDVLKQNSANDSSLGSTATTDISWEIVNEEGDNSEC